MQVPIESIRKVLELAWRYCDLNDDLPDPAIAMALAWLDSGPVVERVERRKFYGHGRRNYLYVEHNILSVYIAEYDDTISFLLPEGYALYRTLPAEPQAAEPE